MAKITMTKTHNSGVALGGIGTGSVELLPPTNVLLYQLVWMIPGFLVTERTRTL